MILKNKLSESVYGNTNAKNENSSVKTFLHSILITTNSVPLETVLLLPVVKRIDSQDEIRDLEINEGSEVLQSYRLAKNKKEFHSRGYRSTSNNCSYCVKFYQGSVKYGFVDYYIQHDTNIYARVSIFETANQDILSKYKGNTRKEFKRLDFNLMFKVFKDTETKIFINVNDIIQKCFIVPNSDDSFVLSDFVTEDEHD